MRDGMFVEVESDRTGTTSLPHYVRPTMQEPRRKQRWWRHLPSFYHKYGGGCERPACPNKQTLTRSEELGRGPA